jgi:hypothetical protein
MRLAWISAKRARVGDYVAVRAEFEHNGRTVKKHIQYGGLIARVEGKDEAIRWGVERCVKEAMRDMAFEATGDPRAWDHEDKAACVAEVIEKVKQCA